MVNIPTSDDIVNAAMKYKPWAGSWWNALIQGLLALGLGIFLYMNPKEATRVFAQFLALYLLISGLFAIEAGPRMLAGEKGGPLAYYKGLAGAVIGGLLVFSLILQFGWLTPSIQLLVLGVGLLIYGALGLYQAVVGLKGNSQILGYVSAGLFLFLGIAAVFFRDQPVIGGWVAPVLMILGVGLIIMAFIRRSNMQKAKAAHADAKPAPAK